jgi:ATP/maltotriose-dependent transcriptional regulator MalT
MLGNLALVYEIHGDIERAHRLVGEVEQVGRATGDRWLIALHRGSRCGEALNTGDLELARRMAEEALQIYIEIGNRRHTPLAELYLGTCARAAADFAGASSYLVPALQAVREIGDKGLEIVGLVELANLATDPGDVGTAWQWLNQVFEAISISDSPEMVPACLDVLARIGQVTGQCDQAARFLGAADGLLELFATNRVWKHEVDAYRRTVEALESALGAVEFERLSGVGRALSVEEAFVELLAFVPVVALAAPDPVGHEPKPGHPLSTREVEVLTLMADGFSNAEIADKLFLSLRTVTSHITHVLNKLDLHSRTAAVAFAIRQGIV